MAKQIGSFLEKAYRNSIYCADQLHQEDGKLTGTYCGNRWCFVCNRVRLARAINRYKPVLESWTDPHFVTLTLPNVGAEELPACLDRMHHAIREAARGVRRTDHLLLRALRKLECTFNAVAKTFHPHFHLVVEGRAAAEALVRRWLLLNPEATRAAQDFRPADASALTELFKYFTKLVVRRRRGEKEIADLVALDVIFRAMRGRRVYQPMGFKVAPDPANDEEAEVGTISETVALSRGGEVLDWEWYQESHDWVDRSTGELLTGFDPSVAMRHLVESLRDRAPPSG